MEPPPSRSLCELGVDYSRGLRRPDFLIWWPVRSAIGGCSDAPRPRAVPGEASGLLCLLGMGK